MAKIKSVKGTRDYYPDEMALRNLLYEKTRYVSESFGYQEYDGPFLESLELYAAKSGEELVKEQSFVFPDRGGELITLRPELTPSLARMVAQRQNQLVYPLRWWSWGPFWRYERPQKGRAREFFQWNIDLIGVDTPQADAELVAVAVDFLREVGLKPDQVSILVNDRKLMDNELSLMGVAEDNHQAVFKLIDRRDKLSTSAWHEYASDIGLNTDQISHLEKLLENQQLWQKSETLQHFFTSLKALGVSEFVHYAPNIIRGLDYYTGIVFEMWDHDGEFRAILGGGRYDNLVADVGGQPLPAVGFAMGDMVISLVLGKFGVIPKNIGQTQARVFVTVFDESMFDISLGVSTQLRNAGIQVVCYPEVSKLVKQFKYADRLGMAIAVVIGPDEQANHMATIKDLRSGHQNTVSQENIVSIVQNMLEKQTS